MRGVLADPPQRVFAIMRRRHIESFLGKDKLQIARDMSFIFNDEHALFSTA